MGKPSLVIGSWKNQSPQLLNSDFDLPQLALVQIFDLMEEFFGFLSLYSAVKVVGYSSLLSLVKSQYFHFFTGFPSKGGGLYFKRIGFPLWAVQLLRLSFDIKPSSQAHIAEIGVVLYYYVL